MGGDAARVDMAWSYSRSKRFNQCNRRWHFATHDNDPREDQRSPPREPDGASVGTVVHEAIAEQMREWREHDRTSLGDAKESAEERMTRVWEEFLSGEDVRPDRHSEERQKMISICKKHVTNVFRDVWPRYEDHTYISHEQSATFAVDGYPVTVRLDLCLRAADGTLRIVDWKTGMPDRRADVHPQLMTYALWAFEHLEPDLSKIIVEFVSTGDANVDKAIPKKAQVDSIRDRIVEESRLWSESTAVEEYPPNPREKLCASCEYLERCDAGREVVG